MAPPLRRAGGGRGGSRSSLFLGVVFALVGGAIYYQVQNHPNYKIRGDEHGAESRLDSTHPQESIPDSESCSGVTTQEHEALEKELSRLRQDNEWLHQENDHLKEQYSAMEERLRHMEEATGAAGDSGLHAGEGTAKMEAHSADDALQAGDSGRQAQTGGAGDWHHEMAESAPVKEPAVVQKTASKPAVLPAPPPAKKQAATSSSKQASEAGGHLEAMRQKAPQLLAGTDHLLHMKEESKSTVFATPKNYYFTHAGPKKASYAPQSLPAGLAELLSSKGTVNQRHRSCAIVGNGRQLLSAKLGEEIDKHDAVMRFNQGPYRHYEPYVGSKTTYRLINHKWAEAYLVNTYLQLEKEVVLVVSRTDWQQFLKVAKKMQGHRPDVTMRLLTRESADAAGNLLREMKSRLEALNKLKYPGKGSPSSGWVGLHFMLQVCESVTTYGVGNGPQPKNPSSAAWHYFENRHFKSSREFGSNPHHSFDLEHDALEVLDAGGVIKHVKVKSNPAVEKEVGDSIILFHGAIDEDKPHKGPQPGQLTVNDEQ